MGSITDSALETTGSCMCGEVQYSFTVPPVNTVRCHCHNCRKLSGGSNTLVGLVPRHELHISNESALKTSPHFKHHASDVQLWATFCSTCGTGIFKEGDAFKGVAIVFLGTIDKDPRGLLTKPAKAEIWTPYRLGWNEALKDAKQCEAWP